MMMTQQEFWILFFLNIVRDLKILDYNNCDPLAENIQEPVLKATIKYRSHSSMRIIGEVCKKNPQFSFRCVDKDEILKEILNLDASKACHYLVSHQELLRKMLIFP